MGLLDSAYNYVADTVGSIAKGVFEVANHGESQGTSSGNDLAQSKYRFDYTVFPSDLGMDHFGHYMIININVPTEGLKTSGLDIRSPAGQLYKNNPSLFTPLTQSSKVDTLRFGSGSLSGGGDRSALAFAPRQTRRIAESIAIYIPGGFSFRTDNEYQSISMTQFGAELVAGAVGRVTGGLLTNFVTGIFGGGTETAVDALNVMGNPINPSVEILFTNVAQREFAFTFLLAPRNEYESITIKKIIKTLRYHAAPEINTSVGGLGLGLTWIPPADFDITFMDKGVENTNLMRINTCVLTNIDVNYTPYNVYSTFRNGHPVSVIMTLNFKELEPVHKKRVTQGF